VRESIEKQAATQPRGVLAESEGRSAAFHPVYLHKFVTHPSRTSRDCAVCGHQERHERHETGPKS
jgi:hypothetical protein